MKKPYKLTRREFLKQSAITSMMLGSGIHAAPIFASTKSSHSAKRVIVIGIDGMDPLLCERLMAQGKMQNLNKLRKNNGYRVLATSIPPQSPVAWSNFINGAGPGSHGIFDFIHRDPSRQCAPFFAVADTVRGEGFWRYGQYKIPLEFWPFNHKPPHTELNRKGVPFWDYLDKAGISSTFYNLPSNYPASPSKYGHHQCLSGMGTPDLLGTYGTYQYFAENISRQGITEGGGKRSNIDFENETAKARLI